MPSVATSNSRSYISSDGILYVAGGSGVSSININTAREGKNDAKLIVPFIKIVGREVYVNEGETVNTLAVNIVKEKAFYEHLWFWALVMAVVILMTLLVVRAYTRNKMKKLLKKEEEDRIFIRQIIRVFAKNIDVKDQYTNGHSFRVAEYTKMTAENRDTARPKLRISIISV